ncbi:hypothetical protein H2200_007542 [Cladophialophora chaetospira]|uniref:Zn(2)-C6 fungal-type domain-containing protein n=1 Tax=Cladophialophora chaetospira TaxID=386627 RepID=A0AA38X863_9EURO|nr:hypothetical protein H2200_007542 [Cladophialophora chaetospira]
MVRSSNVPSSSKPETQEIKEENQFTKRSKVPKACAACRSRRMRCRNVRPCEPCVRGKRACRDTDSAASRTTEDTVTETIVKDSTSTGDESLSDFSELRDSNQGETPDTPRFGPTQTKTSLNGRWKLEIYWERGSLLVLQPGSVIARLSRGNDEERETVQVSMQNDSPTCRGRRYVELRSTYEFIRVDDETIRGGWRPDDGIKFGFCGGSTASLPWMYEILLRYPNNFLASDDDELSQLFEAVSKLHELEFESICGRGFSARLLQLKSFQFYYTALYLQWRERGLVSVELTNSRYRKPHIKAFRMQGEWVHVVSFTHVDTDGSLRHATITFQSFTELVQGGWLVQCRFVKVPTERVDDKRHV